MYTEDRSADSRSFAWLVYYPPLEVSLFVFPINICTASSSEDRSADSNLPPSVTPSVARPFDLSSTRLNITENSVTLSWDGGDQFEKYGVIFSPSIGKLNFLPENTAMISALDPYLPYKFQVFDRLELVWTVEIPGKPVSLELVKDNFTLVQGLHYSQADAPMVECASPVMFKISPELPPGLTLGRQGNIYGTAGKHV